MAIPQKMVPRRLMQKANPPEYEKADMPIAADFKSTKDSPCLILHLKPTKQKEEGGERRMVSIPNTAVRVQFNGGAYRCVNYAIYEMLKKHKDFGKNSKAFGIDERDQTGFWRELGMIKTKEVTTVDVVSEVTDVKAISSAITKKKMEALAAKMQKAEEDKKPIDIKPLAIA